MQLLLTRFKRNATYKEKVIKLVFCNKRQDQDEPHTNNRSFVIGASQPRGARVTKLHRCGFQPSPKRP